MLHSRKQPASQAGASPAMSQPQFAADYASRYRRAHYTKSIYLIGWVGAFPIWLIATNAYSESRVAVLVILLSSIALAVVAFTQYLKHRKIAKQRYAEWQEFETNRLYPTALRALPAVEPAAVAATQETEPAGQEIPTPSVEFPSSADIVSRHNRARITKYLCLIAGLGAFPAWIVLANLYPGSPGMASLTLLTCLALTIVSFMAFARYRTLARKLLVERQIVEARRGDAPLEDVHKLGRKNAFWTIVLIVSFCTAFSGNFIPEEYVVVPLIALPICGIAYVRRRMLAPRYHHLSRRVQVGQIGLADLSKVKLEQPPVVYLRSFDDDVRGSARLGGLTEEEHIAGVLSHFGPFVAVGRPGERLPEVGAHRFYVSDSDWQDEVRKLIKSASLIVLRTGESAGLKWELTTALGSVTPDRLLIIVDDQVELQRMLAAIKEHHPAVETKCAIGRRAIGSILGFVGFNPDWTLSPYPTARFAHLLSDAGNESLAGPRIFYTLRGLFERRGIPWPRPPLNWLAIAGIVGLLGFLVWIILHHALDVV